MPNIGERNVEVVFSHKGHKEHTVSGNGGSRKADNASSSDGRSESETIAFFEGKMSAMLWGAAAGCAPVRDVARRDAEPCIFAGWKPALPGHGAARRRTLHFRGLEAHAPRAWRGETQNLAFSRAGSPRSQGMARRDAERYIFAGWKPALPGHGAARRRTLHFRGLEVRAPRRSAIHMASVSLRTGFDHT